MQFTCTYNTGYHSHSNDSWRNAPDVFFRTERPEETDWLLFLVVFRIFPNWNCHFRPGLWKAGCDVVRLYVLQSYRSCTFCNRETRGETQFWIELAAPCTFANDNEINSDDTLPFIIVLTPSFAMARIACGANTCCYRHVPYDVIRPLTGGICRTFHRVIERFLFSSISLLSLHSLRSVFLYIVFFTNRVTTS